MDIEDRDYEQAEGWEDASEGGEGGPYYNDEDHWDAPEESEGSGYEVSEEEVMQAGPSDAAYTQDREAETNAEKAIEGNFRRLVDNIKANRKASVPPALSKAPVPSALSGMCRLRNQKGLKFRRNSERRLELHGPRGQPQLSQQVKALLGEGNAAYVSQNIPEAACLMKEAIRIEPRVPAAWATLALYYQDEQPEKALKLKIIRAHLVHDVDLWLSLGSES
ncbi:hypothetical protein M422DRAFT_262228, partial [Sphaerobolus stellatus SS14]